MKTMREFAARLAALENGMQNIMRPAKVTANESGLLRVTDGAGFDPKPMHQMAMSAGGWSMNLPAGAGTPGFVFCPGGDPELAMFMPCSPSGEFPAASTDPNVGRLTNGQTTVSIEGARATLEAGEVRLGGGGGPAVARVGDQVACSCGPGTIVSGSSIVTAT